MANDQSIRSLMVNGGYDNNKIGFDQGTNTVTYDNRPFYKGGMNVNGTVFTDKSAFDNAHNQYQKTYGPGTIFTSAEDSIPYDQRLALYANNPTAGQNELSRATQVSQYNQATGRDNADTVAHIQRLQQIMGVNPQANPYDRQYNDMVSTIMNRVNNPQPYDVYSSPEYAAAKSAIDRSANQDVRRAQESLGASGFGRSTNLQDRAQMIQNDASQQLLTQVVPQLIAQNQQRQQQEVSNLVPLLNAVGQQQQTYDTRQQRQFENNLATNQDTRATDAAKLNETQVMAQLTGKMPDGTPTNATQQQELQNLWAEADRTGTIPDALADFYGMPKGTKTFQAVQAALDNQRADRQLDISQQNANTSSANARINALMDVWQKTGKAPAGLESLGIAEGTSLADAKNTNDTQELEGLYSGLQSGQIDPASAIDEINNKTRIGLYTPAQAAGLLAIVQQFNTTKPVTPMPAATDQQIQANGGVNYQDLSMKEIESLWNSDPSGKEAGRPLIDWGQWVKDPRGKSAGVSYEAWHQAYGPSLRAK